MLLNSNKSKSYVVGFSGSSVTAGHDSFFNEAFPKVKMTHLVRRNRIILKQVFEDAMRPAIEAMGMHFIVRNHALGNNPCYPYDACIKTHLVRIFIGCLTNVSLGKIVAHMLERCYSSVRAQLYRIYCG